MRFPPTLSVPPAKLSAEGLDAEGACPGRENTMRTRRAAVSTWMIKGLLMVAFAGFIWWVFDSGVWLAATGAIAQWLTDVALN